MNTYKLPLLKEWMQPLLRRMKEKFLVAVGKELIGVSEEEAEKVSVDLKECGGVCRLSDIEVVRFASTFNEQVLSETLKKGEQYWRKQGEQMGIYESLFKCQAFFNFYILGIQGKRKRV